MNTITLARKLLRILQAVARTILLVACAAALRPEATEEAAAPARPAALAAPAAVPVVAEEAVFRVEQPAPEQRPSRCGDLPRAPWNTCVALHDHEI
jgi:hypothetical protein